NEILMYLRKSNRMKTEVSFDEPLNIDWDGNELLLSDVLGTEVDLITKDLETKVDKQLLIGALTTLNPREQKIMELRFDLDGKEEKTQKDVAHMMGISQSYISRLQKKIIHRLQKEFKKMMYIVSEAIVIRIHLTSTYSTGDRYSMNFYSFFCFT